MLIDFKFEKIEKGDSKNVINLFFTDRMAYHREDYNIEPIEISGDFSKYPREWFFDEKNYTVGTTDKKVYIRYNDGSAAIELAGLGFKFKYKVKQRDTIDNVIEGEAIISL